MTGPAAPYAVVLLRRGRRWDDRKPMIEQQGVDEHLAYLGGLHAQGLLESAGPFQLPSERVVGDRIGMVVYRTDREQALEHAQQDPAVRSGLLECQATSWYP